MERRVWIGRCASDTFAIRKVARDNTVKYRRSTLLLLPGTERPTYAGLTVEVLEMLDSELVIEHDGQVIPSQEAPRLPASYAM